MVTNMIGQLQESFPLRSATGSFEISFTKCGNFIKIYKINKTLHGRFEIRILSSRPFFFIDDKGQWSGTFRRRYIH